VVRRTFSATGLWVAVALCWALCFGHAFSAGTSASASATVNVAIIQGLYLQRSGGAYGDGALDFGIVILGTATINPRTSAGAVLFTTQGAPNASVRYDYNYVAPTNGAYSLTYSPDVIGNTLPVPGSALDLPSGSVRTLNSLGSYYVYLGGTVTVPWSAPSGMYYGSFTLTATYD